MLDKIVDSQFTALLGMTEIYAPQDQSFKVYNNIVREKRFTLQYGGEAVGKYKEHKSRHPVMQWFYSNIYYSIAQRMGFKSSVPDMLKKEAEWRSETDAWIGAYKGIIINDYQDQDEYEDIKQRLLKYSLKNLINPYERNQEIENDLRDVKTRLGRIYGSNVEKMVSLNLLQPPNTAGHMVSLYNNGLLNIFHSAVGVLFENRHDVLNNDDDVINRLNEIEEQLRDSTGDEARIMSTQISDMRSYLMSNAPISDRRAYRIAQVAGAVHFEAYQGDEYKSSFMKNYLSFGKLRNLVGWDADDSILNGHAHNMIQKHRNDKILPWLNEQGDIAVSNKYNAWTQTYSFNAADPIIGQKQSTKENMEDLLTGNIDLTSDWLKKRSVNAKDMAKAIGNMFEKTTDTLKQDELKDIAVAMDLACPNMDLSDRSNVAQLQDRAERFAKVIVLSPKFKGKEKDFEGFKEQFYGKERREGLQRIAIELLQDENRSFAIESHGLHSLGLLGSILDVMTEKIDKNDKNYNLIKEQLSKQIIINPLTVAMHLQAEVSEGASAKYLHQASTEIIHGMQGKSLGKTLFVDDRKGNIDSYNEMYTAKVIRSILKHDHDKNILKTLIKESALQQGVGCTREYAEQCIKNINEQVVKYYSNKMDGTEEGNKLVMDDLEKNGFFDGFVQEANDPQQNNNLSNADLAKILKDFNSRDTAQIDRGPSYKNEKSTMYSGSIGVKSAVKNSNDRGREELRNLMSKITAKENDILTNVDRIDVYKVKVEALGEKIEENPKNKENLITILQHSENEFIKELKEQKARFEELNEFAGEAFMINTKKTEKTEKTKKDKSRILKLLQYTCPNQINKLESQINKLESQIKLQDDKKHFRLNAANNTVDQAENKINSYSSEIDTNSIGSSQAPPRPPALTPQDKKRIMSEKAQKNWNQLAKDFNNGNIHAGSRQSNDLPNQKEDNPPPLPPPRRPGNT